MENTGGIIVLPPMRISREWTSVGVIALWDYGFANRMNFGDSERVLMEHQEDNLGIVCAHFRCRDFEASRYSRNIRAIPVSYVVYKM